MAQPTLPGFPDFALLSPLDYRSKDKEWKKTLDIPLDKFLDEDMDDEERWKGVILNEKATTYGPDGEDGNYRVDRQGHVLEEPLRYIYAIQINDKAPFLRTSGRGRRAKKSGGHHQNSNATHARIEAQTPHKWTPSSPAILTEAFYQSVIVEESPNNDDWLHGVHVTDAGNIYVKKNEDYKKWVAAEKAKAEKLARDAQKLESARGPKDKANAAKNWHKSHPEGSGSGKGKGKR